MSGTSLDGIDVVLVEVFGKGLQIQVKFLKHFSSPFDESLSKRLRFVAEQNPCTAGEFATLANDIGTVYASACLLLAKECNVFESIILHRFMVKHFIINHHTTNKCSTNKCSTYCSLSWL